MDKEEKKQAEGLHCERYYAAGSINIEKIDHVKNLFPGSPEILKAALKDALRDDEGKEENDEELSPLEKELMPIFMNDKQVTKEFVKAVDGQKPTAVTQKVNMLLKQRKLLKANCKGKLWTILHNYGLYEPTEATWNRQVN